MPLHYLDPTREPRECPCRVTGCDGDRCGHPHRNDCECAGTGRINADARPDVEVYYTHGDRFSDFDPYRGWYWVYRGKDWATKDFGPWAHGVHPTETAAVEAARAALKGGK